MFKCSPNGISFLLGWPQFIQILPPCAPEGVTYWVPCYIHGGLEQILPPVLNCRIDKILKHTQALIFYMLLGAKIMLAKAWEKTKVSFLEVKQKKIVATL